MNKKIKITIPVVDYFPNFLDWGDMTNKDDITSYIKEDLIYFENDEDYVLDLMNEIEINYDKFNRDCQERLYDFLNLSNLLNAKLSNESNSNDMMIDFEFTFEEFLEIITEYKYGLFDYGHDDWFDVFTCLISLNFESKCDGNIEDDLHEIFPNVYFNEEYIINYEELIKKYDKLNF